MTRFVSNSYSALYRIYIFRKGEKREKKREEKYLTICTVIRIGHRLRVARIISHVRNVHAQQIDVRFNVHTRNYAHTNRVNVSINVRQTTYESVGLQYDSNHFRTDRFFDAIDNLSNNDNYFSTTVTTILLIPYHPATSMDFQYR